MKAKKSNPGTPKLTTKGGSPEPIAIIGIGRRFPGNADSPERFWQLLKNGVNAITSIPEDRWGKSSFYDPDPLKPGKTYAQWGGFIKDISMFDADFFGISPKEASRMDPQQRLLLEVSYQAIEDAGLSLNDLSNSNTGVFVGISTCDYGAIQGNPTERQSINAYTNLGIGMCIAANRLSYQYNFHGPSFAVDTACSSSLVATHLACQSIWNGESSMALVGGVNAILKPEGTIGFSKASMLSKDGRCKSFDANANGYVRSEGAGMVILKPLSKAIADKDSVYAVIRGTAINQDGRTTGIALPNQEAQAALLKEAYEKAGLDPANVGYVEAHGTGTTVGDPIEVNALGTVISNNRSSDNECYIGSVKTNIGHLEAASGIAGLIKAALCIKHRQIAPNLHFETPNPHIPFSDLRFKVPQSLAPLTPTNNPAFLAGINSFGFGGANAHVILGLAPDGVASQAAETHKALLLPLSARSEQALKAYCKSYIEFLTNEKETSLSTICGSASLRREHHDIRLAVVGASKEEMIDQLNAYLAEENRLSMSSGRAHVPADQPIVFI
ncbi:MAG: beta-ketoacyl synthase N-terminal-like domain-containing protein, partial [Bacteroidota bacterium]